MARISNLLISEVGKGFLLVALGLAMVLNAAGQARPVSPQSQPGALAGRGQPQEPKDPQSARASSDDYVIGAGDVLQISVWKEPEVSVPSVVVRQDGMITVPLLKDVAVVGRTPRQVEKTIVEGLLKYFTDPNVTVVLAASNSKKIYVIGGVNKEGPLSYAYRMTVMQALSEAGGLTDYAKRKKIYIIRTENGRDYRLDFNYDEVVRGERMEQNIMLMPGDTIVIPR
jgi:polysaccharide biosynthesis/export protein